jgi:hypothetical protein
MMVGSLSRIRRKNQRKVRIRREMQRKQLRRNRKGNLSLFLRAISRDRQTKRKTS